MFVVPSNDPQILGCLALCKFQLMPQCWGATSNEWWEGVAWTIEGMRDTSALTHSLLLSITPRLSQHLATKTNTSLVARFGSFVLFFFPLFFSPFFFFFLFIYIFIVCVWHRGVCVAFYDFYFMNWIKTRIWNDSEFWKSADWEVRSRTISKI